MKILFIVLDTLRADHLSCYGYHRPTSPNIDKLASEGLLFLNVYPTDVPTQPSYTAMFTGQRGISTGIVTHGQPEESLPDQLPILPQILGEKGYTTAAVSTLYSFRKWFARGFEFYIRPRISKNLQWVTGDEINARAIPWIKNYHKEDFFLFVHYWDPHAPYFPPQRYRSLYYRGNKSDPQNKSLKPAQKQIVWSHLRDHILAPLGENITDMEYVIAQYDGEITYVDEKVGELLSALDEVGIAEDTLIILTSDHGESLGEHNIFFDHACVYEPTVHVPLIVKYPPKLPAGRKIDALVQLIDLAPTVLDFLQISAPKEWEGRSLVQLMTGKTQEGYAEVYCNQGLWRAQRMMRNKRWKLIKTIDATFWEAPLRELYDLVADPGETHNVAEERKDIADELELQMQRWLELKLGGRHDPLRVEAAQQLAQRCKRFGMKL